MVFKNIYFTFLVLSLLVTSASSKEIGGVNLDQKIDLRGADLILNGAGVRYRAFAKVSVTAIYATKKFASLEEVMSLPGPKRLAIAMLRDIPSAGDVLGKTMTRGIEENYPKTSISKIIPSLIRISEIFNTYKTVRQGDQITIDSIPGSGVVISINGKPQGEPFTDSEIFRALLSIYIGPTPSDFRLKDALLGVE